MEEERGNLYEETGCFVPNNTPAEITVESGFSPPPPQMLVAGSTSNSNCSVEMEELSEFHLSPQGCCPQAPPPPPPCDHQFQNNINLIHQMAQEHSNWDNSYQDFVNLGPNSATTPDLLSLLHLPRCSLPPPTTTHHSMFPNSFSDIMSSSSAAAVMYDTLFHLNFPLQPQRNGSCLLGVDDQIQIDATNGGVNMMYYDGGNNNDNNNIDDGFDNGIIEFNNGGKRKRRGSGKSRTFPTERERRVHFNDRFFDLKNLIPNPTKNDRASIVGEGIDYIKELLRTIEDLKMLVEKKRFGKFRSKKRIRANGEEDQDQDQEQEEVTVNYKSSQSEVDQSCFNKNNNNNNTLRCSWLKRKSKVTEVDVRIIDDEVTIKLVQKKKINCLLFTTRVLDQLQLDLHHVAGGQIGEHYSFLFNTKICEGSCVYASGIADSVMEVVEKQYMEAVPTNGY